MKSLQKHLDEANAFIDEIMKVPNNKSLKNHFMRDVAYSQIIKKRELQNEPEQLFKGTPDWVTGAVVGKYDRKLVAFTTNNAQHDSASFDVSTDRAQENEAFDCSVYEWVKKPI